MEAQENVITPEVVALSLPFEEYLTLVREAVAQGKSTGLDQSAFLAQLNQDNLVIMERTFQTPLRPDLVDMVKALPRPQLWLVLTEGWCGDAAVHLPVLAALAQQSEQVELRTLLRTEHPAVMDAYLTNGGKSIPKLIALDAQTLQPLGSWGPRPQVLQEFVLDLKKQELPLLEFIKKSLQHSEENNGVALQAELLDLLPQWIKASLG
ncbi:thioredoxin family protein [Rufibacter glacialis]|uniref:Thioredoxin family protein n=1 Tax=Rufibacter glacialis TaxID=1259555 RepID=A0A5M8QRY3_9BACT|nr:thioredoxin family protein [Rufibacter glacialis]KAA6437263.1 thioredoxin family protein [Rufibacter glacialis]GGK60612.1 thioredoxin [Rufibacter glacialis]